MKCQSRDETATRRDPFSSFRELGADPEIGKALRDSIAKEKMEAYLLPALCAALLDHNAEVKVQAIFHLLCFGKHAKSTLGALRGALKDGDARVRKVAEATIKFIDGPPVRCW